MKIRYLVLHHSAVSYDDVPNQFNIINRYHKSKGWGKIGYHYLIEANGKLMSGRAENVVGAHCRSCNINSIGICLAGNFDIQLPTSLQEATLNNLLSRLKEKYPEAVVKYHRHFSATHCPGLLITNNYFNKNNMTEEKLKEIYNELLLRDPDECSAGYLDHDETFVREQLMKSVERELIEGIIYSARKL